MTGMGDGQFLPLRPGEWGTTPDQLSTDYIDALALQVSLAAGTGGVIVIGHDASCRYDPDDHPPCLEIWVNERALVEAPDRRY